MEGGVFGLGNPGGRGGLVVPEIRVEGGSKKSCHPSGGVDFFWNNPMQGRPKFSIPKEQLQFLIEQRFNIPTIANILFVSC